MSLSARMSILSPTEREEEIEHELDESLPIFNFASCMSDELIEFMLDFFDLIDEKELCFDLVVF